MPNYEIYSSEDGRQVGLKGEDDDLPKHIDEDDVDVVESFEAEDHAAAVKRFNRWTQSR